MEKRRRPTVTLLVPVLNEAACLPAVLPVIDASWVDDIVFVDGQSTDGTVEILRRWGRGRVIIQKERGLSNAFWEAFPLITTEVIISFSPDGNSLPEAIPRLVEKIAEGYDLVIASRYLPGAGSDDDDPVTAFGNWMFTKTVNLLFGGRYTDSLVMLRAYRKALISELPMETREPVFEPQMAIRCAAQCRRVAEIPAREPRRIGGDRKMRIFVNGWAILKLIIREWALGRAFKAGAAP